MNREDFHFPKGLLRELHEAITKPTPPRLEAPAQGESELALDVVFGIVAWLGLLLMALGMLHLE